MEKQSGKGKWIGIGIAVFLILGIIGNLASDEDSDKADNQSSNSTIQANDNRNETPKEEVKTENNSDKKNQIKDTNTTEKKNEEKIKYITITSTKLIKAFKANQVKCKRKYDGKYLKVTGTVDSVGTDVLNHIYVCLGSENDYTIVGIQCYAKNKTTEDKIAELSEGDKITVTGKGECGSLSFSLQDAEIID